MPSVSGCGLIAGASYRAGEAGAQATAQSERIRPGSVANRFQAISQARRVVILRVFAKKTQKTPRREIELARKRAKEVT